MMKFIGSIGFETDRDSWISKMVRWFTRSKWSHVFIVGAHDPVTGEREILEANWQGVQKAYLKKYLDDSIQLAVFRVEASQDVREAAYTSALGKVGRSYGFLQLLGFIPVLALRLIFIKIDNPITSGRVCSELALEYLRALKVEPFFDELDENSASPQDLLDAMELRNDMFHPVPIEVLQ